MTVKELITELQTFPPDHKVVMTSNHDADDCNEINKVDIISYQSQSAWSGQGDTNGIDPEDDDDDWVPVVAIFRDT